jgi:hypothetical protein
MKDAATVQDPGGRRSFQAPQQTEEESSRTVLPTQPSHGVEINARKYIATQRLWPPMAVTDLDIDPQSILEGIPMPVLHNPGRCYFRIAPRDPLVVRSAAAHEGGLSSP